MRVVVANALAVFRAGVRKVLLREGDFEVAEAATLEQLVSIVEGGDPGPGTVRNALAGALFAAGAVGP